MSFVRLHKNKNNIIKVKDIHVDLIIIIIKRIHVDLCIIIIYKYSVNI